MLPKIDFMKALKPSLESPQRSVKIKISANFLSSSGIGMGKVRRYSCDNFSSSTTYGMISNHTKHNSNPLSQWGIDNFRYIKQGVCKFLNINGGIKKVGLLKKRTLKNLSSNTSLQKGIESNVMYFFQIATSHPRKNNVLFSLIKMCYFSVFHKSSSI